MMKSFLLFIVICVSLQTNAQIRKSLSRNNNTKSVLNPAGNKTENGTILTKEKEVDDAHYRNIVKPWSSQTNILIRNSLSGNNNTKSVLERVYTKKETVVTRKKRKEVDYVLYRNIVRQHTWLVGQGEPITQEVANHLPYYFRLSMKNPQGHWQHIEAMHGDTMTTHHNQHTYIINTQNDEKVANKEWMKRLKQVTQWFITADMSDNLVAEERAYDKDGYMIYGFIPIQNDSIHVTGSYIDAWGYPVDMMEREENTYGSVVYITYDKQGGDYIIDFLDGEGMRKLNSNGVDQERTAYDEKMRLLLHTSHNCVGDYCLDNWGNCGNKIEYAADGHSYTITRVDADLRPMRMPAARADAEGTYIRCKVLLDKWGREKERIFLNEKDENDATLSNIHRIVYEYFADGRIKTKTLYDINGDQLKND